MKDDNTNKQIGAWLAKKRKEKNLSQQNVADMFVYYFADYLI